MFSSYNTTIISQIVRTISIVRINLLRNDPLQKTFAARSKDIYDFLSWLFLRKRGLFQRTLRDIIRTIR